MPTFAPPRDVPVLMMVDLNLAGTETALVNPDGFARLRAFLLETSDASDHLAVVADVVPE